MHPTQCWDDTWTQGAHSWCRPLYPLAHVFDYPSAHSQVLFASTWRDGVRSDRRTEAHSQPHNGIMDHNTYSPSPTQPPPIRGMYEAASFCACVRVCVCRSSLSDRLNGSSLVRLMVCPLAQAPKPPKDSSCKKLSFFLHEQGVG